MKMNWQDEMLYICSAEKGSVSESMLWIVLGVQLGKSCCRTFPSNHQATSVSSRLYTECSIILKSLWLAPPDRGTENQ